MIKEKNDNGITFNLAPDPKWSGMDANGNPLVGGKLYTYKRSTRVPKATYADSAGSTPNTNPVILDSKGQATIYWASDEDYYVELYDRNGQLIYTRDNYNASSGGGSGHNTVYKKFENYCRNAQFNRWSLGETLVLGDQLDAAIMDGWRFQKSNINAKDFLTRKAFALGQSEVPFNPVYYAEFSCTDVGKGGEIWKALTQDFAGVQCFANREIAISFYAKASGAFPLEIQLIQDFGSGASASQKIISLVAEFDLTTNWNRYTATYTVPNVNGKTISDNGDDKLVLAIVLPSNTVYNSIALSNVQLQLGDAATDFQYQPNEMQKLFWQMFPTGYLQPIHSKLLPPGWIWMDDGTIGNTHSKATNRANFDTIALYTYFWESCDDTLCPVSDKRGTSAVEDFYANKTIQLPRIAGRTLIAAGSGKDLTARKVGEFGGAEMHSLTAPQLAPHLHSYYMPSPTTAKWSTEITHYSGMTYTHTSDGSEYGLRGEPHNIMQPWAAVPYMIKL